MNSRWLPAAFAGLIGLSSGMIVPAAAAPRSDDGVGRSDRFDGHTRGRAGDRRHGLPAKVEVFAPQRNHRVGIGGRGWIVDLAVAFDVPLAQTGFTINPNGTPGFQITGPAAHNDVPPFPGTFSAGADDRLPGLIVLLTTTTVGAGPCLNVANLFNLTGITDVDDDEAEIWDSWIIGAPNFGVDTSSTLFVALADDLDGDGIYNDAPDVVPDSDGDGVCTQQDLMDLGVASNIEQVKFFINGPVDLGDLPVVP
ncbi:MAG: hypothetical protein KDJ33_04285 [Gammaproteobacteria bacterium]|nr:hypothetical protein [Gammaproteobacteria bacterium]